MKATIIDWIQSRHALDTLQLVWQIVSLKSLSLQPLDDGRGGHFPSLSLLFGMNLENPSAQRPRSGHGHAGNPDAADGIAMGTGPLTTISYSREEKRAISPSFYSLTLRSSLIFSFSLIFPFSFSDSNLFTCRFIWQDKYNFLY